MNKLIRAVEEKFPERRIVVIGDLVADQFLHGTIDRVSREAPVFILKHEKTITLPGGAGNAAVNAASLGAKVFLIGLVGNDINGKKLVESLRDSKVDCTGVLASSKHETVTKVRVLASRQHATRQQVIRIDYVDSKKPDEEVQKLLLGNFFKVAEQTEIIIISDYGYGVASGEFLKEVMRFAKKREIPILVDSRYRLGEFMGVTSATPNQEEIENLIGKSIESEEEFISECLRLRRSLNLDALLVTRGSKGMTLFENGKATHLEAIGSKEPVDVTGAGDTVIATYSLALASGLSFLEAAIIANHAGGIVVMKKGTARVEPEELIESLRQNEK
ncbi:MAG: PfkB family carbohydrate kinase [Acidobacteriota bacterium]|nr:PfkB family carbohydrate kinase [Acidobacteriota bacterium]